MEWFASSGQYEAILVSMIHKDTSTLGSIYTLTRCEWVHEAGALVRMFCESLLMLRYIKQDKPESGAALLGVTR